MNHSFKDDADPQGSKQWNRCKSFSSDSDFNQSSGFDCNICLDSVQDPVVTLCGHLYCWPCIYRWLESSGISSEHDNRPQQCPVCKSGISHTGLIPLHGREQAAANSSLTKGTHHLGAGIPRRPPCPVFGPATPRFVSAASTSSHTHSPAGELHGRGFPRYSSQPYFSRLGHFHGPTRLSSTTMSIIHPIIGIFGETLHTRILGNSITNIYAYPNAYHLDGASPRVRRLVMQADKSLSRICFFLLCCCILCLLLF